VKCCLAFANQNISITFVPRGIVVLHMPDNKFSGLPPTGITLT